MEITKNGNIIFTKKDFDDIVKNENCFISRDEMKKATLSWLLKNEVVESKAKSTVNEISVICGVEKALGRKGLERFVERNSFMVDVVNGERTEKQKWIEKRRIANTEYKIFCKSMEKEEEYNRKKLFREIIKR